jgi:hypothetical protein
VAPVHSGDARRWDAETDGLLDQMAARFPHIETSMSTPSGNR